MFKTLPLIILASLSVPSLIAASSEWQSTPPPPPPPPAPPASEPWKSAPAPVQSVHITFQGANPPVAQYERDVPLNQYYYPGDPLSISHIVSDSSVSCTFYGIDGLVLNKYSPGLIDVGPPQTITKVFCGGSPYKAKRFAA